MNIEVAGTLNISAKNIKISTEENFTQQAQGKPPCQPTWILKSMLPLTIRSTPPRTWNCKRMAV